jgi:hypothetical protein
MLGGEVASSTVFDLGKQMTHRNLIRMLFVSLTVLPWPAFAQLPGEFDVPESIWPAGLEWRSRIRSSENICRTATTRFGEISVSQSGGAETGRPLITEVNLNGESHTPKFTGDSSIVCINNVVPLGDRDIVIFVATAGGSGSPPATLNLLSVGPAGIGEMVSDLEFHSGDGTQRIAVTDDRIYFDLGFETELRKSATFGPDGLNITRFETNATSLPQADCWHLFSIVGSASCLRNSSFSLADERWLSSLDEHPAFDKENFLQICAAARAAGSPPLSEVFSEQVCRVGR